MDTTESHTSEGKLQKRLGLAFGIAIMAGGVIGAGILRTPGEIAALVPSFRIAMLLWVLGGIYVFLSVNVASELTVALPKAGGPHVPVRAAFGDSLGLLTGWAFWTGFTASAAALSLAFADFLGSVFPFVAANKPAVAIIAMLAVTLLNLQGVEAGRVSNIVSLGIKLLLLAFVVVAALIVSHIEPQGTRGAATALAAHVGSGVGDGIGWVAIITGLQIVLGAYDGWQGPMVFAEEDIDPAHNIPRGHCQTNVAWRAGQW